MTITLTPHAAADLERLARAGDSREAIVERALAVLAEREETLAAVREGLADIEAGRLHEHDDVFRRLRKKHGLPRRP